MPGDKDIVLDDKTVELIEAALSLHVEQKVMLRVDDVAALCATVKHLRAENEQLRTSFEISEAYRGDDARVHQEIRRDLQSQLEQLRAENERLLRGDFTDEELQGFCHNLSEQDRDAFFEGCTKYQERLFGTSAIAQLKENQ